MFGDATAEHAAQPITEISPHIILIMMIIPAVALGHGSPFLTRSGTLS